MYYCMYSSELPFSKRDAGKSSSVRYSNTIDKSLLSEILNET